MNSEKIEAAARAIRDAVRISIRPNGGTMELLEQGHTFHLNQDEATKAAKAAHAAFHPTMSTVEELDALKPHPDSWVMDADGWVITIGDAFDGCDQCLLEFPATVLYTPGGAA